MPSCDVFGFVLVSFCLHVPLPALAIESALVTGSKNCKKKQGLMKSMLAKVEIKCSVPSVFLWSQNGSCNFSVVCTASCVAVTIF